MGRAPCCEKNGLKKGPWTPEEDKLLIQYIHINGCGNWRTLPKNAGLQRCGKSCRLRWTNYLRPDIKRGRFSFEEEETIIQLHTILGNKWSAIAARLPGRTDNEIKNYWNTHVRKRLLQMGIDTVTHHFRPHLLGSTTNSSRIRHSGLLRMQPSPNYSELMRLASSFLHSYSQNLVQINDDDPTQFQDFAIPYTFLDHQLVQCNNAGDFVQSDESGLRSEQNGSTLLTQDCSLPMLANYDCYGSGQIVVDPASSLEGCAFQLDSSSNLNLHSLLSTFSIPTMLQF